MKPEIKTEINSLSGIHDCKDDISISHWLKILSARYCTLLLQMILKIKDARTSQLFSCPCKLKPYKIWLKFSTEALDIHHQLVMLLPPTPAHCSHLSQWGTLFPRRIFKFSGPHFLYYGLIYALKVSHKA